MAVLKDILYKVHLRSVHGSTNVDVNDLQIDSRLVKPGTCFIAMKGMSVDGHEFINKAVELGAIAVVCEVLPDQLNDDVNYIQVANSAETAGLMANQFFGNVSEQMHIVGVTGTNGKTTIATLLYKPLRVDINRGVSCWR
jgi:UDP-N-acetylmuramoyl-L-alanyl-D-glutamate--2,6-diaminopimelate ligase